MGETLECTSSTSEAMTSDGPAYFCSTDGDGNADCPPVDAQPTEATDDGSSEDELACDGEFYCTKQAGKRTCRKAPKCDEGAHRVQMDCDADATFGFGDGANAPAPPASGSGGGAGYPGAGTSDGTGPLPGEQLECFYPTTGGATPGMPAATAQYVLEALNGAQVLHVRLTFSPSFVDNSYGTTSVGWGKGHKFAELVGSDHSELTFLDKNAQEKLHFKMDYISQSASAPSGYQCLGVTGGEGRMILGDPTAVVAASTSLDRNLNERGYKLLVDSPATDASYTPSATAPKWDYRVVYEAWIKNDAFGPSGFGSVRLAFVHASPSKLGTNTLPVTKGDCPPGWGKGPTSASK